MELLYLLESLRSPLLDAFFGLVTRLGEETVAIIILAAIYWCIDKKLAYRIGIAYFISGLCVQGMKIVFRIDRPWVIDPAFQPVSSAVEQATGYSYPSGHTQSATALFGTIGTAAKHRAVRIGCYCLVALVAISRMYLGVHTPLDVVTSLVLTGLCVALFSRAMPADEEAGKLRGMALPLTLVLTAMAVIAVAAALHSAGTIEQSYLTDCLKAAGAGMGFAVSMYIERSYIDFSTEARGLAWQAVKYALGIAGVLVIKEGIKLLLGTGLVIDTARYFLMIAWVVALYPLAIKRFFAKQPGSVSQDKRAA